MANLAKQVTSDAGVAIAFSPASAGGDVVPVDAQTVLLVNNGSGASINVTIVTPGTEGGLAIADRVVAVAAGAIEAIGPFGGMYKDSVTDGADVSYSATASVTVAALAIP